MLNNLVLILMIAQLVVLPSPVLIDTSIAKFRSSPDLLRQAQIFG
ncbi:MAG: hypothetical protein WC028_28575 [Candidatus Obscuribacterales bacterium]|jgi:hypothetical protein